MTLERYKKKRDLKASKEPLEKGKSKSAQLSFFVQRHDASHLHYDFRLEHRGVLLSWAIPKGPSMNPKDKRLAIEVEDHPYSYGDFEGTIPQGHYGAGTVKVWDKGSFTCEDAETKKEAEKKIDAGLKKGHLKINLKGKKLKGNFDLVKLKNADKDNMWLLVKNKDQYATDEDIIIETKKIQPKKKERKLPAIDSIEPMLATLVERAFNDVDWIFEIKWDGYRCIAYKGTKVDLRSRGKKSFNTAYPIISEELKKIEGTFVVDGEIVALDSKGKPKFQLLQNYKKSPVGNLCYYVFDLLFLNGKDLREYALIERKELLKKLIGKKQKHIMYNDHVDAKGIPFFKASIKQGLEGIIAKKKESTYRSGRGKDWLKIKGHNRQEVVIGGFTEPRGSRSKFGALLVGVYDQGDLIYSGHVGGGFDEKMLKDIHKKLEKLVTKKCPFLTPPVPNMPVQWVKPQLVCEVKFSEWTGDHIMRQPIFEGLRVDKKPKEVVKETPQEEEKKGKAKPKYSFITHPDKIYWPDDGITKGELLAYYDSIAPYILPYLKNRPLMMHRFPDGIEGNQFYQKNVEKFPDFVETARVQHSDRVNTYAMIQNAQSLIYVANLGSIELHPFNAPIEHLEDPDYLVLDLDPEDISFEAVIEVAQTLHKMLDELNVAHFCKTSGATGLHIYIPLNGKYDYEQTRQCAELFATMVQKRMPDIVSLVRSPKKRQKKVYVDYLQNREMQTVVSPYSVRARPLAPVSTPLEWKEVKRGLDPTAFTIKTVPKRLEKKGDIFKPVIQKGVNLEAVLKKLIRMLNGK